MNQFNQRYQEIMLNEGLLGKALGTAALAGSLAFGGTPKTIAATTNTSTAGTPTVAISHTSNQKLIDFIKSVENNKGYKPGGWRKGKWYEYLDKGVPAIGYGHRLLEGEKYPNGITDEQAVELVKKDIAKARSALLRELRSHYKYTGSLDPDAEMMLIDFEYNLGTITKFPKFVRALINRDWKGAAAEYKRHSEGKEIGRNVPFYKTFLADKTK